MESYFSAEEWLIDRIKERVSGLKQVQGGTDLSFIFKNNRIWPSAHVLFKSEALADNGRTANPEEHLMIQHWLVVVAVRNVRDIPTGNGLRHEAGPLIQEVQQALLGWKPYPGVGAIVYAGMETPTFMDGQAFFPLKFMMRMMRRGVVS